MRSGFRPRLCGQFLWSLTRPNHRNGQLVKPGCRDMVRPPGCLGSAGTHLPRQASRRPLVSSLSLPGGPLEPTPPSVLRAARPPSCLEWARWPAPAYRRVLSLARATTVKCLTWIPASRHWETSRALQDVWLLQNDQNIWLHGPVFSLAGIRNNHWPSKKAAYPNLPQTPLLPIASLALKPNAKAIYYWVRSATLLTQS